MRFLLELCALAAAAYWGWQTASDLALRILLAAGAALLVGVVWGIFLAPKSSMRLGEPLAIILEVVIFGLAAAGLAATGHPILGGVLVVTFVINRILMAVWAQ